jgi:TorA maturation chaperone TorD
MSPTLEAIRALWRVDLYRVLALGFDYPSLENAAAVEELLGDVAASGAERHGLPVPAAFHRLAAAWSRVRAPDYRAAYHRLFDTQSSVAVSESAYRRTDRGAVMRDVTAFYSAFGHAPAASDGQPDDVRHQLGFMALLAFKEWVAGERGWPERAVVAREAQTRFLDDHLAGWAGVFAERVRAAAPDSVYALLADLLDDWVREDGLRFAVSAPSPGPPPDAHADPLCGGCPAAGGGG